MFPKPDSRLRVNSAHALISQIKSTHQGWWAKAIVKIILGFYNGVTL